MFSAGQHFILYTYAWMGMGRPQISRIYADFLVALADCFFILSQISQISQIFYTVLKKLTRSFLGWEAMGLGAGRYEIVVRKLVGEKCTEL